MDKTEIEMLHRRLNDVRVDMLRLESTITIIDYIDYGIARSLNSVNKIIGDNSNSLEYAHDKAYRALSNRFTEFSLLTNKLRNRLHKIEEKLDEED